MNVSARVLAVALMAAAAPCLVAPAVAGSMSSSLGLQNAAAPLAEAVQYRRAWRGGYRGGGFVGAGVGLGLGLAAGIGGAIVGAAQPYGYYGYAPGYAYGPSDAYGPSYAYAPGYDQGYVGGNDVAYCQQRFRSYDPGSGTYLGFDGVRHPCP